MFMTASTFPKAPLYFGKSGPKTFPNSLHMSENCCLISGGKMVDGSILIVSGSLSAFFMAGVVTVFFIVRIYHSE